MDDATVALAERAALGSLLLEPENLDHVRAWLRPDDFADWWRAQAYTALLERRIAGEPIGVEHLAQDLVDRLGERSGDRLRVVDLLHDAPGIPATLTYARMVAEAGLRREVAGQGVLLRAGALQSAMADSAGPLASACLLVDSTLESIARRWADATGRPRTPSPGPTMLRPPVKPLELRAGADKFLADRPPRDPVAEREHAVTLIGSLIAHPEAIEAVADWLRPSQIADPGWRAVYGVASDLAARGEPIDPVTVAWRVAPLRTREVPVPSVEDLVRTADDGWFDHPVHAARIVAGEQARALADRISTHLEDAAADPTVELAEILDTAGAFTNALRHVSVGLAHDTAPAVIEPPDLNRGPVAG
ncbi:DnaB-like helicase N-terminal domain-containing protein [Isoptericola sp. b490]|uniref:DnaB-like helicase N-terminal domain-containing protein n=1 Tax=Actinotalea lenta TaxID=3064654 RepID=UPI0027122BCC|nr:DnaB-like helicase N-terminal domain-containing protein [Isoptericola sp. b490]MDO8119694.1 DnaB-like helicase N-terminal domain-containing protein [Isoptericola sp. b490]